MTLTFLGLDMSSLGYLIEIPDDVVTKKSRSGTIFDNEIVIKLNNEKSAFTGDASLLAGISIDGEKVQGTDDYGDTYIDAFIRYGRKEQNKYQLFCQSVLAKYFDAQVVTSQTTVTPADAIKTVFDYLGFDEYLDESSFGYAAEQYAENSIYINAYITQADSIRLVDFCNAICELGVLDIYTANGKVFCQWPEIPTTGICRTIASSDMVGYPNLEYFDQYFTSFSVDYIGSGNLPAEGGASDKTRCWQRSDNKASMYQVESYTAAYNLGLLKMARDGKQKRRLRFFVDLDNFVCLFDETYLLTFADMDFSATPVHVISYKRSKDKAEIEVEEI